VTQPIYEIALPAGFGYVAVILRHATYGTILGVDRTLHQIQQRDLTGFTADQIVIFPLEAAVKAQTLSARHIGERPVADVPRLCFKFAVRDKDGDPIYWWLWNGDTIEIAGDDCDLSQLPERTVLTQKELVALWA